MVGWPLPNHIEESACSLALPFPLPSPPPPCQVLVVSVTGTPNRVDGVTFLDDFVEAALLAQQAGGWGGGREGGGGAWGGGRRRGRGGIPAQQDQPYNKTSHTCRWTVTHTTCSSSSSSSRQLAFQLTFVWYDSRLVCVGTCGLV